MSGHRKTDSTCDETALLRGQSHSRESSGASNLSVKFTVAPDAADTAAIVEAGVPPARGGVKDVPAVSIVAPGSPPSGTNPNTSDNRKARSLASAVSHRKKRQKLRKSGKQQHTGDADVADDDDDDCSDPEDVDGATAAAANSRLQNGTCDTTDTPPYNNNEGMLQSGEAKSHNSDYGSFSTSDNYRHHPDTAAGAGAGTVTSSSKQPVSAIVTATAAGGGAAGFPSTSSKGKPGPDTVDHQSAMATDQRQPLLDNSPTDSSCSDDDAGVSSGYTRRKTRLHQRPSNDRARPVGIEVDDDDDAIGPAPTGAGGATDAEVDVHIPMEPCKTLLAFIFLFFAWVATTTSLALTHDRVPAVAPLPDIILDNVTYQHWGLDASEIIIMVAFWIAFLTCIFHKHRFVVLRRVFILVGLHYYYRAITMFVTVMPVADTTYRCADKLNSTEITPGVIARRVLKLLSGFGLSINGEHIYCGDYIYSGHSMTLIMVYLVVKAYSPKRWFLLHYATFCLSFAGILFLVLARGHYSIDVVVAYWITTRLWYIYHTMTNNGTLLKDSRNSRNYLRKMWWWYMFYYFECNVPVTVPREYSLPLPKRVLRLGPCAWLLSLCGGGGGKRDEADGPAASAAAGEDVETVSSEVARQDRTSDVESGRRRRNS